MTKWVQLNRLVRLYNKLITVTKNEFNQGSWYVKGPVVRAVLGSTSPGRAANSSAAKSRGIQRPPPSPLRSGCGMTACIGGWATTVVPELRLKNEGIINTKRPRCDSYYAFAIAFDLDIETTMYLVHPDARHRNPKSAAAAVLRVAKKEAKGTEYEIV